MSWLFSRALVEEYSAATCSDGVPSAPLSVMPTQHKFWRNDKTMEPCQLSRFGLTCAVLTDDLGADLLTWFLADSRVRTYQLPGMVPALMASDPVYGEKWRESSVMYDLNSSSWKIHLSLFPEDLPWSLVTLPKWGMTRSGAVYQHPIAERPISGIVSGLWLPTPSESHCETRPSKTWNPKSQSCRSLGCMAATGMWPTPRSCSAMAATITPESAWQENRFPNLETIVGRRMWPTPVASMSKGSSPGSLTRKSGADRSNDRLDHAVMASDRGQLNPTWVEWLMGWPLGWTDLKPLEMARFREWRRQHLA